LRLSGGLFDFPKLKENLILLEEKTKAPSFWEDSKESLKIIVKIKDLKEKVEKYDFLVSKFEELNFFISLLEEEGKESDKDLERDFLFFSKELDSFEISLLLNGPYDKNSAILSLHPGAGGVESADWAQMLLRMYLKWFEEKKYKVEILDILQNDQAGIKSATVLVKGRNAFGYLKAEKGVHRLVRISPFDASCRRHTSFALVDVIPEFEESLVIEINDEDLKIDTFRSSGAGGQHVNTTDSAVRITHLPTNIVVTCQSERSQLKNKEKALKVLKYRLYAKKLEEQQEKIASLKGEKTSIAWGNQIRSYILHPYYLVKDHRTGVEVSNVLDVLDGNIDIFIKEFLRKNLKTTN